MSAGHCFNLVLCLGFAALLSAPFASAQQQPPLNLMPWPSSIETGSGNLPIDSSFSVALTGHTEPRLDRAVERFWRQLERQTAISLTQVPGWLTKEGKTEWGVGKAPPKASREEASLAVQKRPAYTETLTVHTERASKEVQELGED